MAFTRRKRQGKVRVRGRKPIQRIAWPTSAWAVKALAVERRGHARAVRGDVTRLREAAAILGEASIAHRMRGVTHWCAGEFAASRGHLEQATAIFDPERDGDLAFRFGQDPGIVAAAYLAEVLWLLGEVRLADQRMTETTAQAAKSGHAATSAYGFFMATRFELIRRNPDRAATFARSPSIKIANEHQLPFWMAHSPAWFDGWLEWRSGDRKPGLAAMRNSLARQAEQGSVTTFFETLLAEAEAGSRRE